MRIFDREKRVDRLRSNVLELHCHTKMSDMRAAFPSETSLSGPNSGNEDAMAVTDHGCVQSFPDANHSVER